METEEGQAQVIQHFVNKASTLETTSSVANLIAEAIHTLLFSLFPRFYLSLTSSSFKELRILLILICFAYLLMEPGVITNVKETNFTPFLAVDFGNSALLPKLLPDQILKLKQLTVLTLSETNKVLSYNKLQEELEVSNVRELEDFLINDCMYTGTVKGKLNQVGRCFEVQFAAESDLMHGQLGSMIDTLGNWLATSDTMLSLTEEKIDWASKMCQLNMDRQQELQGRIDEAKKNIHYKKSQNKQDLCFMEYGDGFDSLGRPLEHEDDLMRSKRSRSPHSYRRRRSLHP